YRLARLAVSSGLSPPGWSCTASSSSASVTSRPWWARSMRTQATAQLSGRSCATKGGVEFIALLPGEGGAGGQDLRARRGSHYGQGGRIDRNHAHFTNCAVTGTGQDDRDDPALGPAEN